MKTTKTTQQKFRKEVILILAVLTLCVSSAMAQKSAVMHAFSNYNIDAGILNPGRLQQTEDYAFDIKQRTLAGNKEKVIIAKFTPTKTSDERWDVVSVDGKPASKGEISTFRKTQVKQPANTSDMQTDDGSFRVEKETADYLVVSFKAAEGALAKDAAFMKDCRSYLTINLKTKKLEQTEVLNEKSVRIKGLTAEKFHVVVTYRWDETENRYFITSENVDMTLSIVGQKAAVQTTTEYRNYSKQ